MQDMRAMLANTRRVKFAMRRAPDRFLFAVANDLQLRFSDECRPANATNETSLLRTRTFAHFPAVVKQQQLPKLIPDFARRHVEFGPCQCNAGDFRPWSSWASSIGGSRSGATSCAIWFIQASSHQASSHGPSWRPCFVARWTRPRPILPCRCRSRRPWLQSRRRSTHGPVGTAG